VENVRDDNRVEGFIDEIVMVLRLMGYSKIDGITYRKDLVKIKIFGSGILRIVHSDNFNEFYKLEYIKDRRVIFDRIMRGNYKRDYFFKYVDELNEFLNEKNFDVFYKNGDISVFYYKNFKIVVGVNVYFSAFFLEIHDEDGQFIYVTEFKDIYFYDVEELIDLIKRLINYDQGEDD
jgi:hypothetical protein